MIESQTISLLQRTSVFPFPLCQCDLYTKSISDYRVLNWKIHNHNCCDKSLVKIDWKYEMRILKLKTHFIRITSHNILHSHTDTHTIVRIPGTAKTIRDSAMERVRYWATLQLCCRPMWSWKTCICEHLSSNLVGKLGWYSLKHDNSFGYLPYAFTLFVRSLTRNTHTHTIFERNHRAKYNFWTSKRKRWCWMRDGYSGFVFISEHLWRCNDRSSENCDHTLSASSTFSLQFE